jgi:tetratricopeptide (TPR) repeat protein
MPDVDPFDEIARQFESLSPDKFKERLERHLEANPNEELKKIWDEYNQLREQSGKREEKIRSLDTILEIDHENFLAWFEKGRWLGESNKHQEALHCFEKVTELKPDRPLGWANRGYALNLLGKNEGSLQYFDKAIKLDPNHFLAWEYKGMALGNLSKFEEAIECFDKATELDSKNILSYFWKGVAFHSMAYVTPEGKISDHDKQKYENAVKCFDKAIEISDTMQGTASIISYVKETSPFSAAIKLFVSKGITLLVLHKPEEALKCFDRVLEIDGEDAMVMWLKSLSLQELDKTEESNKYFESAFDLGFNPPKEFLTKARLGNLTEYEIRKFQDNEEKSEDEEFNNKSTKEKKIVKYNG